MSDRGFGDCGEWCFFGLFFFFFQAEDGIRDVAVTGVQTCALPILLRHLSEKLPVSRWQRDLTDSTALRNMGVASGHTFLAYDSCSRGLNKLEVSPERLAEDLENAWEVLAEPIQTVMRRYGIPDSYEQLKELTRGKSGITKDMLHGFIDRLAFPESEKVRLREMTPQNYVGEAAMLARKIGIENS